MILFLESICEPEIKKIIDFYLTDHHYLPDDSIFQAGDQVKGLFIISKGKVKVTKTVENNEQLILRLASDGMILGHRGFNGDWKYPVSAIALTDVLVKFLPIDIFNMIAKTNARFTYQILMFFADELKKTEDSVAHLQVKNRISRFIYRNYEAFGYESKKSRKLSYTIPRKDLAIQAGTTYESTIRVLSQLAKEKVIEMDGKELIISDLAKLKELAFPNYV